MNCLLQMRSYISVAVCRRTSHIIAGSCLNQCYFPSWKSKFKLAGVRTEDLEFLQTRFHVCCYSTRRKATRMQKSDPALVPDKEKDVFFVVRKGDIVGIYKSFSDCQAQVGSLVCDPPVSVFKGHSLNKDAEEYLASFGLKNALYAIKAADLKQELLGTLLPCPIQEPASSEAERSTKDSSGKRSHDMLESGNGGGFPSTSMSVDPLKQLAELHDHDGIQVALSDGRSCIIEFDGASKGNPGLAGAAAVIRTVDGNLVCKLRQGLGIATNNAAEYQGVILGLKYALEKGYTDIHVKGDSKLVCMQIQGLWKVKHKMMTKLYEEAKILKDKCFSFQISHVLREYNSDADAQANLAARLEDGEVQLELGS